MGTTFASVMLSLYPYLLATHIIFVVTWFAALFYIVRLYIYHREALDKPTPERDILHAQFSIMESRLMHIIGTPSMILVVITGSLLLSIQQLYLQEYWIWAKLFFVSCIIAYHFLCLSIQRKLQQGIATMRSTTLRMFNELATIFLVAVVFLIELRSMIDMLYGLLGLIVLSVIMLVAIRVYKRSREKQ